MGTWGLGCRLQRCLRNWEKSGFCCLSPQAVGCCDSTRAADAGYSQAYPRHPGCLSSWPSLRGTCTRCTPGSPLALAVLCTFPKTSWLMANNWSLGPGDPCVMLVLAGG